MRYQATSPNYLKAIKRSEAPLAVTDIQQPTLMDEASICRSTPETEKPLPTGRRIRFPPWDSLCPELLCLIFVNLAADELLRSAPFVCRAWREAVAATPWLWRVIDIHDWCRRAPRDDPWASVDRAVRNLAPRGGAFVEYFSAYNVGAGAFDDAMSCFKALTTLKIPRSAITDELLVKHLSCLSTVTELDISCCPGITHKGIEAIGKNCKLLVHFNRSILPPHDFDVIEDEALAVAKTMPGLRHLELTYGLFSDEGLTAILDNCKSLAFIDIGGCVNVLLEGDLEERCYCFPGFREPFCKEYEGEIFKY